MKIGVIYGGISREREISIKTGEAIIKALVELGYDVLPLLVEDDLVERVLRSHIDIAFIALHGKYGEDGTVQGLLELLKIPYTGSSALSSALAMDKIMTKKVWCYEGIKTPLFQVIKHKDDKRNIDFPLVVKPPKEGSTIGISIVKDEEEYMKAVEEAFSLDKELLVEEYIKGKELTVAVFNEEVFTPIEISPKKGFYDYFSKYTKGETEYIIPPRIESNATKEIMDIAKKAYDTLNCSGAARVDFILSENGVPYALEINTIPGMTETSLLPKACAYHGIGFKELVEKILKSARLYNL
ncbi:MAG: D-alanine--D-alanine ligase [bacterium]